jgi:hypothetical protein
MPQHGATIAALLLEQPTCLSCVASNSRLTAVDVERYLTTIATALVVFRLEDERCRVCGNVGAVYSVRPSSDSTSRPRTAGAGDTHDDDLRPRARLLVDAREIPTIHARNNVDQIPCGLLCGRPFVRGRSWYEIRFSSRSFWLDDDCFGIWQEEMERAKPPRA